MQPTHAHRLSGSRWSRRSARHLALRSCRTRGGTAHPLKDWGKHAHWAQANFEDRLLSRQQAA